MKEYIFSICIASVVCSILLSICGKSTYTPLIKMICGVFLAITLIAPIKQLYFNEMLDAIEVTRLDGKTISGEGEQMAKNSVSQIISQQTRAYILDKAQSFGADISVEVTLDESNAFTPCSAQISGAVSPYCKRMLQEIMEQDLGISKENQIWR